METKNLRIFFRDGFSRISAGTIDYLAGDWSLLDIVGDYIPYKWVHAVLNGEKVLSLDGYGDITYLDLMGSFSKFVRGDNTTLRFRSTV